MVRTNSDQAKAKQVTDSTVKDTMLERIRGETLAVASRLIGGGVQDVAKLLSGMDSHDVGRVHAKAELAMVQLGAELVLTLEAGCQDIYSKAYWWWRRNLPQKAVRPETPFTRHGQIPSMIPTAAGSVSTRVSRAVTSAIAEFPSHPVGVFGWRAKAARTIQQEVAAILIDFVAYLDRVAQRDVIRPEIQLPDPTIPMVMST